MVTGNVIDIWWKTCPTLLAVRKVTKWYRILTRYYSGFNCCISSVIICFFLADTHQQRNHKFVKHFHHNKYISKKHMIFGQMIFISSTKFYFWASTSSYTYISQHFFSGIIQSQFKIFPVVVPTIYHKMINQYKAVAWPDSKTMLNSRLIYQQHLLLSLLHPPSMSFPAHSPPSLVWMYCQTDPSKDNWQCCTHLKETKENRKYRLCLIWSKSSKVPNEKKSYNT